MQITGEHPHHRQAARPPGRVSVGRLRGPRQRSVNGDRAGLSGFQVDDEVGEQPAGAL
jgi:hypothetical protein